MEQGVVIMTNKQNLLIEVTVNLGQMWTDHASVFQLHMNFLYCPTQKISTELLGVLNNFNRKPLK